MLAGLVPHLRLRPLQCDGDAGHGSPRLPQPAQNRDFVVAPISHADCSAIFFEQRGNRTVRLVHYEPSGQDGHSSLQDGKIGTVKNR
jgi:hypothetical protein